MALIDLGSWPRLESEPRRCYEISLTQPAAGTNLAHCRQIIAPGAAPDAQEFERRLAIERIIAGDMDLARPANVTPGWTRSLLQGLARLSGLAALRIDDTQRASIRGLSIHSATPHAIRSDGQYIIEIARFGAGGARAYRHYEQAFMHPVLSRYGYQPELELQATRSSGLGFRADLVKIGCFSVADACERLWRYPDPDWAAFMRYLYRHVAPDSVWILARLQQRHVRQTLA
jgi:hypothetical protein